MLSVVFANRLTGYLLCKFTNVVLLRIDGVFRQNPLHANYVFTLGIVRGLLACRESIELVLYENIGNQGDVVGHRLTLKYNRLCCVNT